MRVKSQQQSGARPRLKAGALEQAARRSATTLGAEELDERPHTQSESFSKKGRKASGRGAYRRC